MSRVISDFVSQIISATKPTSLNLMIGGIDISVTTVGNIERMPNASSPSHPGFRICIKCELTDKERCDLEDFITNNVSEIWGIIKPYCTNIHNPFYSAPSTDPFSVTTFDPCALVLNDFRNYTNADEELWIKPLKKFIAKNIQIQGIHLTNYVIRPVTYYALYMHSCGLIE